MQVHTCMHIYHCKKGKVVLTQFCYCSFLSLVCVVRHSGIPLPALDSTQIKNLIWLSRTLANVMGKYFANEIVQSCGKGYETEVTAMVKTMPTFSTGSPGGGGVGGGGVAHL